MVSSETQTDSQITGWHDGNAAKLTHLGNSTARTPMLNTSVSRDIHEPKEQKISRGACGYNRGACTHRNTTTFFRPTTCKVRYTLPSNIFEDCNRLSGTAVSFDDLGDTIKPHPLFCYAQGRAGQSDYLTWGVLFHGSNYMPTTLFRAWHTPYLFPPSAIHRVESIPITSTTATQLQEDGAATILSSMSAQSPRLTPVPSHARS